MSVIDSKQSIGVEMWTKLKSSHERTTTQQLQLNQTKTLFTVMDYQAQAIFRSVESVFQRL